MLLITVTKQDIPHTSKVVKSDNYRVEIHTCVQVNMHQTTPKTKTSPSLASSPGLLIGGRREGERRPGIHCVRMRRYYSDFE